MKVLGTYQFQQKKFKLLGLEGEFKPHLGDVPKAFIMVVYGDSGNGKTEYCIRLAKSFAHHGKVAWISYEQGHGYDLQKAVNRNRMDEVNGQFYIIDPNEGRDHSKTFAEEIDEYLSKRNSPDFIFFDSLDYMRLTWDEYVYLKDKYGRKKTFVFISHANGKYPKTAMGDKIYYDGGIGVFISKFIAYVGKNRFGGFEELIIYMQRAMELNPAYFTKKAKNATKQGDLFDKSTGETPEKMHIPPPETKGVRAKSATKTVDNNASKTPATV